MTGLETGQWHTVTKERCEQVRPSTVTEVCGEFGVKPPDKISRACVSAAAGQYTGALKGAVLTVKRTQSQIQTQLLEVTWNASVQSPESRLAALNHRPRPTKAIPADLRTHCCSSSSSRAYDRRGSYRQSRRTTRSRRHIKTGARLCAAACSGHSAVAVGQTLGFDHPPH